MKPSFKMWWLIIVACVTFNLSGRLTAVVLAVYALAEYIEQWQARKARAKVVDDVLFGWKPKNADSEWEDKGNLTRIRLVGQNPLIVARIAELVERMR
jgi:hypothetical protein